MSALQKLSMAQAQSATKSKSRLVALAQTRTTSLHQTSSTFPAPSMSKLAALATRQIKPVPAVTTATELPTAFQPTSRYQHIDHTPVVAHEPSLPSSAVSLQLSSSVAPSRTLASLLGKSKLAAKVHSLQQSVATASKVSNLPVDSALDALFSPTISSLQAVPSTFGSLLIDMTILDALASASPPEVNCLLLSSAPSFLFDLPSPDDAVLGARHGTRLAHTPSSAKIVK